MSNRSWRAAWLGAMLVIGCGSQAVEYPGEGTDYAATTRRVCTKANQCAAGEGCVDGACGRCTSTADCMSGDVCSNGGTCGPCTSNAQCGDGQSCVDGACGGCTSSAQCEDGRVCVRGSCGACTSSSQCAQGQSCYDGRCSCSSSAQCPSGQTCSNGVCKTPTNEGTDGGSTLTDSGTSPNDSGPTETCATKPVYKTYFPNVPSIWSFDGKLGTEAGDAMCKFIGADHFCDYAEVKAAEAKGELATVPNMTAWIHRTTPALVGAEVNSGGSGARCNDWRYGTNHLANGEFATFSGGAVSYDLAPADKLSFGTASSSGSGRLCGTVNRAILCCHPKCQ